jgi:hypothetical protein
VTAEDAAHYVRHVVLHKCYSYFATDTAISGRECVFVVTMTCSAGSIILPRLQKQGRVEPLRGELQPHNLKQFGRRGASYTFSNRTRLAGEVDFDTSRLWPPHACRIFVLNEAVFRETISIQYRDPIETFGSIFETIAILSFPDTLKDSYLRRQNARNH